MRFEKRLLTSIDIITGEQREGMAVLIPPKSSPYDRDKWFPISQGALEQIAVDEEIKGQTYRVLMFAETRSYPFGAQEIATHRASGISQPFLFKIFLEIV